MESLPLWKGTTMRTIRVRNNQRSPAHCSVPCIVEFPAVCSKLWSPTPPPPPHTFLKWPFHTDFKKYAYTPPKGTMFRRIGQKVQKPWEKGQNPPSWRRLTVPERYSSVLCSGGQGARSQAANPNCNCRVTGTKQCSTELTLVHFQFFAAALLSLLFLASRSSPFLPPCPRSPHLLHPPRLVPCAWLLIRFSAACTRLRPQLLFRVRRCSEFPCNRNCQNCQRFCGGSCEAVHRCRPLV